MAGYSTKSVSGPNLVKVLPSEANTTNINCRNPFFDLVKVVDNINRIQCTVVFYNLSHFHFCLHLFSTVNEGTPLFNNPIYINRNRKLAEVDVNDKFVCFKFRNCKF